MLPFIPKHTDSSLALNPSQPIPSSYLSCVSRTTLTPPSFHHSMQCATSHRPLHAVPCPKACISLVISFSYFIQPCVTGITDSIAALPFRSILISSRSSFPRQGPGGDGGSVVSLLCSVLFICSSDCPMIALTHEPLPGSRSREPF